MEPDGRRLVEIHQPLSKHLNDDPQTLPIVLNSEMSAFKQAAQTDQTVMDRAMVLPFGYADWTLPVITMLGEQSL
ncbi:Probable L,D-transpeptidase YcfS precursor [Raoultella planticola]|nr:Probable L,D-transpeptidase YcfS precursor [Raoultella planticola]